MAYFRKLSVWVFNALPYQAAQAMRLQEEAQEQISREVCPYPACIRSCTVFKQADVFFFFLTFGLPGLGITAGYMSLKLLNLATPSSCPSQSHRLCHSL